jgi:hypothetical protein
MWGRFSKCPKNSFLKVAVVILDSFRKTNRLFAPKLEHKPLFKLVNKDLGSKSATFERITAGICGILGAASDKLYFVF